MGTRQRIKTLFPVLKRWSPSDAVRKIKNKIGRVRECFGGKNYLRLRGLCDNYGGDFKQYLVTEDMSRRIAALKSGLDAQSCALVDLSVERIKNFPNGTVAANFLVDEAALMTADECREQAEWLRRMPECQSHYTLEGSFFLPEVFMYHHGLRDLPEAVKNFIRGKDCIDAGAFVGDSALVLQEYGPRKVFSFEVSAVNAAKYRRNMAGNRISEERFELIMAGVSDHCGKTGFSDCGNSGSTLNAEGGDIIALTTVDAFCAERKLRIGLIKADIEGAESALVRGMAETLKKDRPVLSIAIYHTPRDFFEIKPFLESLQLNYKFAVRKFNPRILVPLWEMCLLAYPAELDAGDATN